MSGRTRNTALATLSVLTALVLAGCSSATPPLPPLPDGAPQPAPTASQTAEPEEFIPFEPSTTVVSATEVNSMGAPRFDVLEDDALAAVGALPDSPRITVNNQATPIAVIEAAGGAEPSAEYVLNLSYKACADVMASVSQGMSLSEAFELAIGAIPETIGAADGSEDLISGYTSAVIASYQYICVPLMDERARRDLEQGVYRG